MGFESHFQYMKIVCSAFIFRNVDEIVVERIVTDERCSIEEFQKGDEIYNELSFYRSLGIVLSGGASVDKNASDGKRIAISKLKPGMCFGAAAMFLDQGNYLNVITALKPTKVLFLPEELLRWAMQRHFSITENYIAYLSERICFLNARISVLSAGSAEQKILQHLQQFGEICSPMTDLSRELNIGRASLYRGLDELERKKMIHRDGNRIKLL